MSQNFVFHTTDGDLPTPADMTRFSLSANMRIRSKLFRRLYNSTEPVVQKSYVEVYLIGREYLSDEEAKQLKKEPPTMGTDSVTAPSDAPALHHGVKLIVERAEKKGNEE